VSLTATGGITANTGSTISATGGAPGFDTFSGFERGRCGCSTGCRRANQFERQCGYRDGRSAASRQSGNLGRWHRNLSR
jgi:hypothetical protein